MKITIFHFSGTGNTWYVAKQLERILVNKGVDAKVYSIEEHRSKTADDVKNIIDNCDKLVLGFPIYCSAAPRNMEQFINNLPKANGKSISVFTTVAMLSGDGTIYYKQLLEDKGYAFETGMEFVLSSNLSIPGFPAVLKVGDQQKIDIRNAKATEKVENMANALIESKSTINGGGLFGRLIGKVQRKYYDVSIKSLNDKLYVEHSKCIKCMRCVKMCPVDNISFTDSKIQIADQCIACMRCYHFCPTNAINITEKSLNTKKWPRYAGPTKDYIKTLL